MSHKQRIVVFPVLVVARGGGVVVVGGTLTGGDETGGESFELLCRYLLVKKSSKRGSKYLDYL